MPLQSRPITAMWANMELGLAGWMASSWPILDSTLPSATTQIFLASGNVAPANPDLARFGAGPSAQKQTPDAGVDGRASDPPRRAFVRRLETVTWREDAVHVDAGLQAMMGEAF